MVEFSSNLDVAHIAIHASDAQVVQAMLVSTKGGDSIDAEADAGRIGFLMRKRHGTPFEHNTFTFYVAAPIFVFREFHRHRIGWSYNEESGRYKQLDGRFYVPPPERPLVQVGKPGAYEYVPGTPAQYERQIERTMRACVEAYAEYELALDDGVAKEVARMVLPVNIYSSMYATCNARSLMAFLSLRRKLNEEEARFPSTPMWEIDQVAQQMESVFADVMPLTYASFVAAGYVTP